MTIEVSLLLSGVSVAFAIYFGIVSKRRNEKRNTGRNDSKHGDDDET